MMHTTIRLSAAGARLRLRRSAIAAASGLSLLGLALAGNLQMASASGAGWTTVQHPLSAPTAPTHVTPRTFHSARVAVHTVHQGAVPAVTATPVNTFLVNTTADDHDTTPNDGVCDDAGNSSECSLRAAIEEANSENVYDQINVPANTYPLTLGTLDVEDSGGVYINGAGAATTIIDGNGNPSPSTVMRLGTDPSSGPLIPMRLTGVTIEHGSGSPSTVAGLGHEGGGLYISQWGTATVSNAVFDHNAAGDSSNWGDGGAIFNYGSMQLSSVTLTNNSAMGGGFGGAIENDGPANLNNVNANHNSADGFGGAVDTFWPATIQSSSLTDNTAGVAGGGIAMGADTKFMAVHVDHNTANDGGGVYTEGGPLTWNGGTANGNTANDQVDPGFGGGGIEAFGDVSLSKVTVSGNTDSSTDAGGGGIYSAGATHCTACVVTGNFGHFGGGIWNDGGQLMLTNSRVNGNTAEVSGGGIFNGSFLDSIQEQPLSAALTMIGSQASNNIAGEAGGGVVDFFLATFSGSHITLNGNHAASDGGGLWEAGSDTLQYVTIRNNVADDGGGIANDSATGLVTQIAPATSVITNATISGNTAHYDGGGAYVYGYLTLRNALVSYDVAQGNGGGLYNDYSECSGDPLFCSHLNVYSSTIDHNQATSTETEGPGGLGGGIYNGAYFKMDQSTVSNNTAAIGGGGFDNDNGSSAQLTNDTIVANQVPSNGGGGGGIANGSGSLAATEVTIDHNTAPTGAGVDNSGTLVFKSSIVATNLLSGTVTPSSCASGNPMSGGFNLDQDGTCSFATFGDKSLVNPHLGPLQNNGGPTKTEALLTGSPAINAAGTACATSNDQRDDPRPKLGGCDMGAYEKQ